MADGGNHNRAKPRTQDKDNVVRSPEELKRAADARAVRAKRADQLRDDIDAVLEYGRKGILTPHEEKLAQTKKVLDVAPELYTVWNLRRKVLLDVIHGGSSRQSASLSTSKANDEQKDICAESKPKESTKDADKLLIKTLLVGELKYTQGLLKEYPKSYWLWNHRAWSMSGLGGKAPWDMELMLVSKMLDMDARNFHGWDYRRHVVSKIVAAQQRANSLSDNNTNTKDVITPRSELAYTSKKISQNFSNYSAWHYRSRLISTIAYEEVSRGGSDGPNAAQLYRDDLKWILDAICTLPSDQSPWLYLEFLLSDPPKNYYDSFFNSGNSFVFESIVIPNEEKVDQITKPGISESAVLRNPLSEEDRLASCEEIMGVLEELWEIEELPSIALGIVTLLDIVKKLSNKTKDGCEDSTGKIGWLSVQEHTDMRDKYVESAIRLDPDRKGMYNSMNIA